MKYAEVAGQLRPEFRMPMHLNGVLMSGYRGMGDGVYRPPLSNMSPGMMHRTSSLEMLNNIKFEEKRALIASTLSLNDLLKPSQDFRTPISPPTSKAQFNPAVSNGYMVPHSLYKTGNGGYNINYLNNGIPEKDIGRIYIHIFLLNL